MMSWSQHLTLWKVTFLFVRRTGECSSSHLLNRVTLLTNLFSDQRINGRKALRLNTKDLSELGLAYGVAMDVKALIDLIVSPVQILIHTFHYVWVIFLILTCSCVCLEGGTDFAASKASTWHKSGTLHYWLPIKLFVVTLAMHSKSYVLLDPAIELWKV